MTEKTNAVVFQVAELLKEKHLEELTSFLEDPKNVEVVHHSAWDLIPVVCSSFKKNENIEEDPKAFFLYENILLILATKGNPKEVLLGLLEQADCFKTEKCFNVLLKPLQKVLLSVPGKRGKSLEEVLSTLYAHILTLPLPQDYNLEGEEKLLLEFDPSVHHGSSTVESYLDFCSPFVEEVSAHLIQKREIFYLDRMIRQREMLATYLLKLLQYPLVYYDLHHETDKAKSSTRVCCEKLVSNLTKMFKNLLVLYDLVPKSECSVSYADDCSDQHFVTAEKVLDPADNSVTSCAAATLAYLIFSEGLASDSRPYVYSHFFIFQKHLPLIVSLLSKTQNLVLYKGLNLAKKFINDLHDYDLSCECLEVISFVLFPKVLTNVAVHCPVEEHRLLSVKLLRSYLDKYDWKGRYRLLLLMISSVNHSGVLGLVINIYKDYLHCCLNSSSSIDSFIGKNLQNFLVHALKLPENAETDLLENSDKIMSGLNLLRYLVLRDKKAQNLTGIWAFLGSINETFLKPLQTGLVLSRAHYKLEKQCLMEEKPRKANTINAVVQVGNQILPNIPLDQKLKIIETALLVFDMIESVLMRINEVL